MITGHPISPEPPFYLDTGHFVGYHDICPWSPDNRWLAAHRASLDGSVPGPDDLPEIARELDDPAFRPAERAHRVLVGPSSAWVAP